MNQHPLRFDREYARHTEFGQPIVNSALTLAVVTGMSVSDVSQKATANLGWTDIRMPAPVFNGDTIYAESEVLAKRGSKPRPTQGVVTILTCAYKPDGTLVMEFKRQRRRPNRGRAVRRALRAW
jgi:acyl dehydratase